MTAEPPASAYDMGHAVQVESLATFAILVDNEPGVLHRVVGLFASRGYNIESLTVAETDESAHTSRITIVTRGTPPVLAQIQAQLEKMVSTRHVVNVTLDVSGHEQRRRMVRRQRIAIHFRAQPAQQQRRPRSFKAGMAGEKDLLAAPERRIGHQILHLARLLVHSSSRKLRSRSESIGCQKP